MGEQIWCYTISGQKEVVFSSVSGALCLQGCCLTAGESSTLYCSVDGRETYAVGRVTTTTPQCQVRLVLTSKAALTCEGGDVLVSGIVRGKATETNTRCVKRFKVAPEQSLPTNVHSMALTHELEEVEDLEARRNALRQSAAKAATRAKVALEQAVVERKVAEEAAEQRRLAAARLSAEKQAAAQLEREAMAAQRKTAKENAAARQTLHFDILKAGTGDMVAKLGKTVQIRYAGRLARTGRQFDKGTIRFRLGNREVIKGWDMGIQGMCVGEKRKLQIPSTLAYGKQGSPPSIPPNADLVFDVELLHIGQQGVPSHQERAAAARRAPMTPHARRRRVGG